MQQYNEKLAEYNYSVKNKDAIVTAATEQYMKENQKAVKALVAQNVEAQVTAAAKKQTSTPAKDRTMAKSTFRLTFLLKNNRFMSTTTSGTRAIKMEVSDAVVSFY